MFASRRIASYLQHHQQKCTLLRLQQIRDTLVVSNIGQNQSARCYAMIRHDVMEKGPKEAKGSSEPSELGDFKKVLKKPKLKEPFAKALFLGRVNTVSIFY